MTITGNKLKELEELKKKGQLIYPTSELSPDKVKELEELKKKGQLLYPLPPLKEPAPVPEPTVGQKTPEGKLPMQQIGQLGKAIPYTPPWKPQPSPEYIPSEEELKQRQEMERLIKESKEPATFSVQNAVTALRQEVERIPQPAKTIGAFLGYSFKSGINETDANIVWLANQFATGALSLTESIGELFGKPENWLEPTKLKTIQALTNVMNMYQQQAAVDIEKALSGVPMEQLSPAGQEVVAVLAESIGATVPVLTSLFAGMGMPQITGMAAQVSTWAPTINQFLRMTPFMVFGGTSHARDVENQLQQAGLSPDKAKTWGAFIVGGLFEGITESPVFEQLAKTMGVQGTKKLFSQLFTDIVVNAEQEAIMVPITKSYQQLLGLPQDWDAKNLITEMGRDGLAGAFMGLMLGVNVKGAKTSQQKLADILNKYNNGKIDVVQMVNEVDKVITQDKQLQKTFQETYKESVTEEKVIPEIKPEEATETVSATTPKIELPIDITQDIEQKAQSLSKEQFAKYWNDFMQQQLNTNPQLYQNIKQWAEDTIEEGEILSSYNLYDALTGKKKTIYSTDNIRVKVVNSELLKDIGGEEQSIIKDLVNFIQEKYPNKKLTISIGKQAISNAGENAFRIGIPKDYPVEDMLVYDKSIIPILQQLKQQGVPNKQLWAATDMFHELAHTLGVKDEIEADKFAIQLIQEWAQTALAEEKKPLPPKEVETKGIPAELQPLAQEDTKYKTVEEAAETVTPEAKEPWQMTKEEFSRFDIEIPAGGTSKSPSQIWQWRAMEASGEKVGETLADLVQYSDTSRIKEILGPQYSSLISKIQQGKEITVWRAQPKDQPPGIIPGSYVSESKTYAKQHGENVLGGDYILTSEKVYPDELFVYGDPHEFIYYPRDVETAHKRIIQKAIEENKPVPIEVLREYPELQKTVPITEKVAQPLVGEKVVEAPIAPGTGEWKTRGLAEHAQRNIIAKDIEMIFEDLPQYQAVSSKQATDQIMQLIKQDYPRAVKMALGEEPVPQGILPGWVWTAVQNEATLRKDYETLNKLTSENAMMQFATILGQNVQAFADKNPVSVVAITHEISKAAEKRLEEKYPGKKIKDIKQRQEKKLKESIKEYAPKVDEWSRFIDSLVCP